MLLPGPTLDQATSYSGYSWKSTTGTKWASPHHIVTQIPAREGILWAPAPQIVTEIKDHERIQKQPVLAQDRGHQNSWVSYRYKYIYTRAELVVNDSNAVSTSMYTLTASAVHEIDTDTIPFQRQIKNNCRVTFSSNKKVSVILYYVMHKLSMTPEA